MFLDVAAGFDQVSAEGLREHLRPLYPLPSFELIPNYPLPFDQVVVVIPKRLFVQNPRGRRRELAERFWVQGRRRNSQEGPQALLLIKMLHFYLRI